MHYTPSSLVPVSRNPDAHQPQLNNSVAVGNDGAQPCNFLFVCIRIPKCGSWSLHTFLSVAFSGQRIWYLPNTLDLDGGVSTVQSLRFLRTQRRNLFSHYGTLRITHALELINEQASAGDLISGGHIDFRFVQRNIHCDTRIITVLRSPFDRLRSEYEYARWGYRRKGILARMDSGTTAKIASKFSLEGYLDFLIEHSSIYGNIACTYLGWSGNEPPAQFFSRHVFVSGLLERNCQFAQKLSERLGKRVDFPHVNTTHRTCLHSFTGVERTKIERLYDRDLALYEWHRSKS